MSNYSRKRLLYLLYSSFEKELSENEKLELAEGLQNNPDFQKQNARLQNMRQMLKSSHGKPFAGDFADRVLNQVRSINSEEENLFNSIIMSFRRFAVVSTAAILILVFNNIISGKELSIDSLLALPQISLENTLASNTLFEGE